MIPLIGEGGTNTLLIVATILGLGVTSQVLADRFRVPSVLFLILSGVAVGPKGLSIVSQEVFGGALTTIVGLSVAIIVFEGSFHLKIEKLRESPSAALRLITIGAAISFLGTTLAVRVFLDTTWGIAALVGALLIATGPTVITPILAVVPVRDRVAAALETEGIVNDVTAAILAVVIFKLLAAQGATPAAERRCLYRPRHLGCVVVPADSGANANRLESTERSAVDACRCDRRLQHG